jgi:hypothetical protein
MKTTAKILGALILLVFLLFLAVRDLDQPVDRPAPRFEPVMLV